MGYNLLNLLKKKRHQLSWPYEEKHLVDEYGREWWLPLCNRNCTLMNNCKNRSHLITMMKPKGRLIYSFDSLYVLL